MNHRTSYFEIQRNSKFINFLQIYSMFMEKFVKYRLILQNLLQKNTYLSIFCKKIDKMEIPTIKWKAFKFDDKEPFEIFATQ